MKVKEALRNVNPVSSEAGTKEHIMELIKISS